MASNRPNKHQHPAPHEEQDPLISAYTNPYVESEQIDAALAGEGDVNNGDNLSVHSGEDHDQIMMTKDKGEEGASSSMKETIEEAKKVAGEVINKSAQDDDGQPWFLAPLVVALYLFFDVGKLLAEKSATHGSTINVGLFNIMINCFNVILAFVLTVFFMGFGPGMTKMFEWNLLKGYIVPSAFFAVSQLFNLLQSQFLQPSTRKVFAQLRILLTAFLAKFIMGAGYTNLQWMMITSIVISVFQFQFLTSSEPNPLDGDVKVIIGLIFSIMSNVAAVLGSLLGEKHMKATKKLPFYLQKFQFEVWTLVFAILGLVTTNPFGAYLADGATLFMGKPGVKDMGQILRLEAKTGKDANIFGAVVKAAWFTVDDVLTKIPTEELSVAKKDGSVKKFTMPNRFNLKQWHSFEDMTLGDQATNILVNPNDNNGGLEVDIESIGTQYPAKRMATSELYKIIQGYAALNYRTQVVSPDAALSTWQDRNAYLSQTEYAAAGMLKNHHAERFRKVPGSLMVDTKFYTAGPFAVNADKQLIKDVRTKFSMHLGRNNPNEVAVMDKEADINSNGSEYTTKTVNVKNKFESMKLFERDSPKSSMVTLERIKKDFEEKDGVKKEKYNQAATYETNPIVYLTVLLNREQATSGENAKDKDLLGLTAADRVSAYKSFFNKMNTKKWSENEDDKKREQNNMFPKNFETEYFTEADMSLKNTLWEIRREYSKKVIYKRSKAQGADNDTPKNPLETLKDATSTVTVEWTRSTYATLRKQRQEKKEENTKNNPTIIDAFTIGGNSKSVSLTWNCKQLMDFQYDMDERKMNSDSGYKTECSLDLSKVGNNIENIFSGQDPNMFKISTAPVAVFNTGTPKKDKDGKYKPETPKFEMKPAEKDDRIYFGSKDVDATDNNITKFPQFGEKMVTEELKKFQKADFWTYAGAVPEKACTAAICRIDQKHQLDNALSTQLSKANNQNPNWQLASLKSNEADFEDPFAWSIYHGFTGSPMPSTFLFRIIVFLAMAANAGQSWMSAYLSKVLSSLWKNICAAVALALVIFFEKFMLSGYQEWAETRVMNVILGSMGIILTVFIFQNAPKPPKPGH